MSSLESKVKERVKSDMAKQDEQASKPPPGAHLTDEEEQDLRIVSMIADKMLDGGGMDVIHKAVDQSRDPAQVIGAFIAQLVAHVHESMPKELSISPRIYFAQGGLVEHIGDDLVRENIDSKIVDDAEVYAYNAIKAYGKGQVNAQSQGLPVGPGASAGPQAGPPDAQSGGQPDMPDPGADPNAPDPNAQGGP